MACTDQQGTGGPAGSSLHNGSSPFRLDSGGPAGLRPPLFAHAPRCYHENTDAIPCWSIVGVVSVSRLATSDVIHWSLVVCATKVDAFCLDVPSCLLSSVDKGASMVINSLRVTFAWCWGSSLVRGIDDGDQACLRIFQCSPDFHNVARCTRSSAADDRTTSKRVR